MDAIVLYAPPFLRSVYKSALPVWFLHVTDRQLEKRRRIFPVPKFCLSAANPITGLTKTAILSTNFSHGIVFHVYM